MVSLGILAPSASSAPKAQAYADAEPPALVTMDAIFNGLNRYLGNFIGEFGGELALNAFVFLSGYALLRALRPRLGMAGLIVGVVGRIASLRNVTAIVAPIADVNNYILPLWLIVLGIVLVRWTGAVSAGRAVHPTAPLRA